MAPRTIFTAPRNKPKISLTMPTLAAGAPMPQIQQINRPVNLVDDEGNVHGRLGDNPNGPEHIKITPPPGATNDSAGGPSYASGGDLLIGGGGYGNQEVTPDGGSNYNPYGQTIGTGFFSGNWQPPQQPQQQQVQQQVQAKPSITSVPLQNLYGQANQGVFNAQGNANTARQNLLNSSQSVLQARSNTMAPRLDQINAKGRLIGAEETQNQMTRGVTQQQQASDQQRLQELQDIYAASQNIPDLTNVAEATNRYRAEDRRASKMGVSPEAEVNLSPGANVARLPGVRPKIMSQEDRLKEQAGYQDPIRQQQLQLAKTAVSLQGTDVKQSQLALERAGLTLEQAQQMVSEAELGQSFAQLGENQANFDLQQQQQAPFPGAVKSSITGEWLTPEARDKEQIQYRENVTQPYTTQQQGQGSSQAGLSESQLLNTIPPTVKTDSPLAKPYIIPVRAELIRRYLQAGLTQEQAEQKADALIQQEFDSRKRAGSGYGETPLNPPANGGQPTPAAAPGTPNVSAGPQLPPGYIP